MKIKELLKKQNYNFNDLCEIMDILRGENGCPWDKAQTHKTIRKNLIEETYEVAEAIDKEDYTLLCEELGDLMLQVVFHSRMAKEEKQFDINDVCDGVCKKLIIRHPHIFSDTKADTPEEVLKNWEEIKKQTKVNTRKSALDGIPPSLPSLMRAEKAGKKAYEAGITGRTALDAVDHIINKAEKVKENSENKPEAERILGKILFETAYAAFAMGIDAEEALGKEVDKFIEKHRNDKG